MENVNNQQPKYIIGIALKDNSKMYNFDANSMDLRVGDKCVVETNIGEALGIVVLSKLKACCKKKNNNKPYKKVLRKATTEDLKRTELNDRQAKEAYQFCLEKVKEKKIPMKPFQLNINIDATKAKFYYTAEGRVDFRALLKELAQKLRMKIEMRQIGVRDEAKHIGGCGPCGEKLCCARFLKDFEPVSIRMAKNQNLALNPLKISGVCGRLLCCLVYENEMYKKLGKNIPKNGKIILTPEGQGKVINSDVIQQKVFVELEDAKRSHFRVDEIKEISQGKKMVKLNDRAKQDKSKPPEK